MRTDRATGGPSGDPTGALSCLPVDGVGEVTEGDDLAALLVAAVDLHDGDVLVVTSKVVSKAEGRVRPTTREEALAGETDRVVARRGGTSIVRTHHGLVLAAAGIDASNTGTGTVVLLPVDPDASARRIREAVRERSGRNVAVLVTDTAGRAWRNGQTDIAVGAAGLEVLHDYAGLTDQHGNELFVTAPAVADELAATADLVKGKLDRRPAAVVRGLGGLVLPAGSHGPGAIALVRAETQDMFGLGAREAVLSAVRGEGSRGFGAPSTAAELTGALTGALTGLGHRGVHVEAVDVPQAEEVRVRLTGTDRQRGAAESAVRTISFAMGWHPVPPAADVLDEVRLRRPTP